MFGLIEAFNVFERSLFCSPKLNILMFANYYGYGKAEFSVVTPVFRVT